MPAYSIKQSTTTYALMFLMVDAVDHLTGKTGLTPTVTLSKNGAAFASPSGAISEVANGWYKVAGNATDSATLGPLALHAEASGADPCDVLYEVVAYNPQDSVRLGLTALPNAAAEAAGGLFTRGSGAGQINQSANGQIDSKVVTIANGVIAAATFAANALDAVWSTAARVLTAGTNIVLDKGTGLTGLNDIAAGAAMTLTVAYDAAKTALPASSYSAPDNSGIAVAAGFAAASTPQTADIAARVPANLVMTSGKLWVLDDQGNALPHTSDIPTAIQNADALLLRDWTQIIVSVPSRCLLNAARFLRNRWTLNRQTGALAVYDETDAGEPVWTGSGSTQAGDPISGIDPS